MLLRKHVSDRALDYGIPVEVLYEIQRNGKITKEGKNKYRLSMKTKRGLIYMIAIDYVNNIQIITLGLGGSKKR